MFMAALFGVSERPGFLTLFLATALCMGVAGLLQGLVRVAWVLCGWSPVLQTAGKLPPAPARLFPFLGRVFICLVGCSALLPIIFSLLGLVSSRLNRPHLPSGPDLPVLAQIDAGWKLETLDGQEVSFDSFRGRAVFLNIWATWCPPCVAEMPGIQDLYDAVNEEGVVVALVTREPPETVRPFVARKGWHAPVYLARHGVPPALQTSAIPATFFLNRRGEVVYRHTGGADWNTEDCRGLLRRLQRE
jgi:thiol-disulfide isomerase/thioredoxin